VREALRGCRRYRADFAKFLAIPIAASNPRFSFTALSRAFCRPQLFTSHPAHHRVKRTSRARVRCVNAALSARRETSGSCDRAFEADNEVPRQV